MKQVNGCGQYWRLMEWASKATDSIQSKYFAALAIQHTKICPECQRMNAPLEEQLFGGKVTVTA